MPLVKGNAPIDPMEVLNARKQFIIDQFNEAGITDNAKHLVDVFYAVQDNKNSALPYINFLWKIMNE